MESHLPDITGTLDANSDRNSSMVVLPAQRNSQGQTIVVASAILVSAIVAILVAAGAVVARRKFQRRKLREKRSRDVVEMCVDRAKYGV